MRNQPTVQGLSARLQDAIRAKGTTAAAVAKACGFSRQNMQRFINGQVSRSRHFSTIADVLGVSVLWLTMGDQSSAPSWWSAPHSPRERHQPKSGDGDAVTMDLPVSDDGAWRSRVDSLKSITMRGDRGRPVAYDGMRLLIDPQGTPDAGDIIVLQDADGMELVCCGETYQDQVVIAGVDRGQRGRMVSLPVVRQAPLVVGVMF
jgi:hypothetical protein